MTDADAPSLSAAKHALLAQRLLGHAPGQQPSGPALRRAVAPETAPLKLYYVVPHEAAMVALRHIVSSLRSDYEVVGLLSGLLGKRFDRSMTVESIAEEVLAEIRLRQPQGPYFIAGYSLGGLVAYEVAGEVACRRGNRQLAGVARHLGARDDEARPSPVVARAAPWPPPPQGHGQATDLASQAALLDPPLPLRSVRHRRGEGDRFRYSVVGHDAPLDIFISERTAAAYGRSAGWDRLHKGEVVVHSLPGNHDLVLDAPQAKVIAEVLSGKLEQIRAHEFDAMP